MTHYELDRLESFFEEGPAVLSDRVIDLVRRDIHGARRRRRLHGWRIGPLRVQPMAAVLALGVLGLVAGLSWVSWQARQTVGDPPATWSGPLRVDADELPVMPMTAGEDTAGLFIAEDPRDAASGWVDIVRVHVLSTFWNTAHWYIEVAEASPATELRGDALASFGLVFDTSGDGSPDYEVRIDRSNGVSVEEASVIDLATGDVVDDISASVTHPDEGPLNSRAPDVIRRTTTFTLSLSSRAAEIRASSPFYAWASLTDDDEVIAWDYAADSAWLSPSADIDR